MSNAVDPPPEGISAVVPGNFTASSQQVGYQTMSHCRSITHNYIPDEKQNITFGSRHAWFDGRPTFSRLSLGVAQRLESLEKKNFGRLGNTFRLSFSPPRFTSSVKLVPFHAVYPANTWVEIHPDPVDSFGERQMVKNGGKK